MDFDQLIPIFGIMLVLVPVTGLTLVLTTRFALKPFVEALAKALRESGLAGPGAVREPDRILELTDQVHALEEQVAELRRARAFDQALLGEGGSGPAPRS